MSHGAHLNSCLPLWHIHWEGKEVSDVLALCKRVVLVVLAHDHVIGR